jgi:hypothetical protein
MVPGVVCVIESQVECVRDAGLADLVWSNEHDDAIIRKDNGAFAHTFEVA